MIRIYITKYFFVTALWALCLCPSIGISQPFDFVPENVFTSSYELTKSTTSSVFKSGTEKESLLEKILFQNRIPENEIDGSVRYDETRHLIKLQYGLLHNVNVGISVPYINLQRNSDLSINNSTYSSIASDLSSTETSDMGDLEIWGLWRVLYNDDIDLRFGLILDGDNAPYYFDQPDKLSLGNGTQDISFFLDLLLYASQNKLSSNLFLSQTSFLSKNVTDSNQEEQTIARGYGILGTFDTTYIIDNMTIGGGVLIESQGETTVDGVGQRDAQFSYSFRLHFKLGNLNLLENTSVELPWECQVSLQDVFRGNNADQQTELGLKISLYF